MLINIYRAMVLGVMLINISPVCVADNKYNFLTEEELQQKYTGDVESFFEANKILGDFEGVEKIKIHYAKFIQENEKGAVVISNGRTESYLKYKELVYDLFRQGYSVYLYDHRGQGLSERILKDDSQKGHVNNFDDYVEDLDYFVKNIVLVSKPKKMFLLAHSMGGGIAVRYLETHPSIFHAAALSSPMLAPNTTIPGGCFWFKHTSWIAQERYAGFSKKPFSPKSFEDNEYTSSNIRYRIFLETYKNNESIQLGGPTRGWATQSCDASDWMLKDAEKITTPILLLQSEQDTAVLPKAQNKFCEKLKSKSSSSCYSDKPIKILGAKHELFIEADKYRMPALTYIFDFFGQHL